MDKETFKHKLVELLEQNGFTYARTDEDKLSGVRSHEYVDALGLTVILYEDLPAIAE